MRIPRVLFFTIFALPGCSGPPAGDLDRPEAGVQVSVDADRDVYAPGDTIFLDLTITNPTDTPVTLRFPSGQRYDFMILDASGESVWTWSADKGFIQVRGEEQIGPGEALVFSEAFPGELTPGRYTVRGSVPVLDGPLTDTTGVEVR